MNLFAEQMKLEKEARLLNKVVPIPTRYNAEALRKEGKCIVHKPASLETFNDDDLPPEAA